MVTISMRQRNVQTHEILPPLYIQPSECSLQRQHAWLLPTALHLPVISSDTEAFPILPEQLEKHLGNVHPLIHDASTQAFPASGSAPPLSPVGTLVLNPPPGTIPAVYAFQASTLGMPSVAEYTRFLACYLDEMIPNKRGKALIDSELLGRIKLILTFRHGGFSDSGDTGSDSDSSRRVLDVYGRSWDTQAFRRWVRNTFVYRQATQTELERAMDFGLLSPPESSLSGPGVPGHPPSAGLIHSTRLVFHRDRPVALRSRIYRVILRAHWITNHAGRDRTWATVQEMCSYIPKRLVYDFVAACPMCRVARSGQFGTPNVVRPVRKYLPW